MSEVMQIRKAERHNRKPRVALLGPAGSGKTLSALLIAKGFGGRTCLIDTENNSADLYAEHELLQGWEYDVLPLEKPYSVERYLNAMRTVAKAGYDNMILDSASHAWAGQGGILEFVDKRTENTNKFAGWREATPKHNEFVDEMNGSPCNLVVTMRVKMDYVLEENDKGKKVPKKVGLQPVQRDGLEYEFDLVLDIAAKTHEASSTKDRTSLFDGKYFVISPETGASLMAWAGKGKPAPPPDPVVGHAEALESAVTDFELAFVECADLDQLKAMFVKATQTVLGYKGKVDSGVGTAALGRLEKAKDARKAALQPPAVEPPAAVLVTEADVDELKLACVEAGLSIEEACSMLSVESLSNLPRSLFAVSMDLLGKHKKKKPARGKAKS